MLKTFTNIKSTLNSFFNKIETTLDPYVKIGIGVLLLASLSVLGYLAFTEKSDITSSTVMITNLAEKSGGSGVIISTGANKSTILTNAHVCGVVQNGGLIITTKGQKHVVLSYKESLRHDLCLITIAANLASKVTLASKAPPMYEKAIVSGHPALLPNVVTEGHFSGNKVISILTGFKPCTEKEEADPKLGLVCMFFNGLPVIKTYETVLVTATIMPGSSGSAIYNSSKELSAVVFAGSGGIGYAFAVPYEHIARFLKQEAKTLPEKYPDYITDVKTLFDERTYGYATNIKKCTTDVATITDNNTRNIISDICKTIVKDLIWRN